MKSKQQAQNVIQVIVPTPLWLQRLMLKNLEKESRNRVSPGRATRAKQILDELKVSDSKVKAFVSTRVLPQVSAALVPTRVNQSVSAAWTRNVVRKVRTFLQDVWRYFGRLWKKFTQARR